MKLKLLFATLFINMGFMALAQTPKPGTQITDTSYSALWQQADSLFTKEFTQEGNETVKQIEALARRDKNYPQLIKALLIQLSVEKQLKETNLWHQLQKLDAEASQMPAPHKNVLQSMLGSAWLELATSYSYYDEQEEPDTTDPTTWPVDDVLKKAEACFLASVVGEGLLKETSLNSYDAVINTPKNAGRYQPMLYDVLMWRLYNFYKVAIDNSETNVYDTLVHPNAMLFADKSTFINLVWQSNPPDTYGTKALRILQTLIKRYQNALQIDALVMADIERIDFAGLNYNTENEDSLQLAWLQTQIPLYSSHRIAPELYYRAAKMISCGEYGWAKQTCSNPQALRYCQTAIATFPDEAATQWCLELAEQIQKPELKITTEFTNLAKTPFKYFINYKNTQKIYVKYIAITPESLSNVKNFKPYNSNDSNQRFRLKKLLQYPVKGQDIISLPADTNLINHTTEWYCNGLPEGHYIVLFSANENFIADTTITGYTPFWSTKYSLYSTRITATKHRFFVADMQNNKPLKGAKIVLSYNDYYTGSEVKKIIAEKITDKSGSIEVDVEENYWDVNVEVYKGDKKILANSNRAYLYNYDYSSREPGGFKTHFITDRGIYRPGQTVYYKGYIIKPVNGDSAQPAINIPATVILEDANGEKVAETTVKSNKYGTYSGSFVIPFGRVTGYYTLRDNYGNTGISVEEYKRPKFEIEFDELKNNPALTDSVTITGRAIAYAGNALDGARYQYKVTRGTEYRPYYDRWPQVEAPQIIAQGFASLDNEGRFTVKFAALPGKNEQESYDFITEIAVTDITGEVQAESNTISVGKCSVYAYLTNEKIAYTDRPVQITVEAKNLNHNKIPLKGTLTIAQLAPEKIRKVLFWQKPDVIIIPEAISKKYFSDLKYGYQTTEVTVGQAVFTQSIDSAQGKCTLLWNAANIAQGNYQIAFEYIDNLSQTQIVKQNIAVANPQGKTAFTNAVVSVIARETAYQPGQTAEVIISSRAPNTWVSYFIERKGKTEPLQQVKMNNNLYKLKIPITEADRGDIVVWVFTLYNNRLYTATERIKVPYDNKDLTVEVSTYRDKMIPGSKEEWQLKITGPDAQKISAEVVASMYDASLDRFTSNQWYNFFEEYIPNVQSLINPYGLSEGENEGPILISIPYKNYYTVPNEPSSFRFFKWIYDPLADIGMYDGLNNSGGGLGSFGTSGFGSGGGGAAEGGGGIMGNANRMMVNKKANKAEDDLNAYRGESFSAPAFAAPEEGVAVTNQEPDNLTKLPPMPFMKVRRDLDETAFFFPHLQTDDSGAVIVKFIAPEALTQWDFRAFAHTAGLKSGLVSLSAITQKPLMVQTNMPRFLRTGDEIYINAKVVNLSSGELSPNVVLEVYDAATGKNIKEFNNLNIVQVPQMAAGVSQSVKWKFTVPTGYGALKIIIKAYDGQYTDAEANTLPVLSDEILVTEALPITFSGSQPKTYELKKLTQSGQSTTLKNHKLTVEYTANPAWYAIQALPYMMEYPHECAEQVFNRYYANSLAQHIANSNPAIRNVFDSWKIAAAKGEEGSFISNLEKNPELKALLLEETPWVAEGKDETARKQRLGILFDENTLNNQSKTAINKLLQMQLPSGAFPWFSNMQANLTITQYIVSGWARLEAIVGKGKAGDYETEVAIFNAIEFMREQADKQFAEIAHNKQQNTNKLTYTQVQYLYAISFFLNSDIISFNDSSTLFWKTQASKYWQGRSRMEQAMIALALHRMGDGLTPKIILKALRQNAVTNADNGMYWKEMTGGYGWTDAPVETQAVIIEAFSEIGGDDAEAINQMRKWLLKQKQLTDWKTTRATADACYALLLEGDNWLQTEPTLTITVGSKEIDIKNDPEINVEAGTGYFKKSFSDEKIKPEMGKVTVVPVNGQNVSMAWGGMYWQYFEKLNNITRAQTPLSLIKQLFIEKTIDSGVVKTQLKPGDVLKTGDKIVVRMYLKANNDMEFVYLKDMRAAALEPVDFQSGSHWQNGVSYYQSIRDASMNFFFDRLPKGQWVFQYEVRVSQAGTFQNGIATVQSMYAPEHTSHSESILIEVKP